MDLSDHALTTLDPVKTELDIDLDDPKWDDYLTRLINAASEDIEGYCRRGFKKEKQTDKLDGNGRQKLIVPHFPIITINSIKINDVALDPDEYEPLDDKSGRLFRKKYWPKGTRNIEIDYEAGYVLPQSDDSRTLPYTIEDACIITVVTRYHEKGNNQNITQEKVEGMTKQMKKWNIPPQAAEKLRQYRLGKMA